MPIVRYYQRRAAHVIPVEEFSSQFESISDAESVIGLAREGGARGDLFGTFCRTNFCSESWEFLVECARYQMVVETTMDVDEHFKAFLLVLDGFLLRHSASEVNVSGATRSQLIPLQNKSAFCALDEEPRFAVFEDATREIALMLTQNLLIRFQQFVVLEQKQRLLHRQEEPERNASSLVGSFRQRLA